MSVAMITGRRRTPLHQGKSDVLGGAVSWADDLKVGEESLAPYSPDLSPLLLGVRKRQGLQAAAHNNPSAQGNCQRSSEAKSFAPSRPTSGKDAKFVSSLTAVNLNTR